ncbi:hypothetical protein GDO78_016024, partial [Eleutherodactylus coqui]
ENGKLCLASIECISKCCQRRSGQSRARCAPKGIEFSECSPSVFIAIYDECPCERGLVCEVDGSNTNSDFRICKDPNKAK